MNELEKMEELDALAGGGNFIPELEIETPTLSKQEQEEINKEKEEIRQLKILRKSPAWKKVKDQFIKEIEAMKFNVAKSCGDNSSIEKIGQEFKIYQICEQKLKALIMEVEGEE